MSYLKYADGHCVWLESSPNSATRAAFTFLANTSLVMILLPPKYPNAMPDPLGTQAIHESVTAALERCRREIARCEAELRAGNPDVEGCCRGLIDWSIEQKMILAAQSPPVPVHISAEASLSR